MQNIDWKRLFLSAEGRIGRQEFWIGIAVLFVSCILLFIPLLNLLVMIALMWASVCLQAKRLHDMGRTAWLMLAPMGVGLVVNILGALVGGAAMMGAASGNDAVAAGSMVGMAAVIGVLGLIAALINLGFLLWIGLTPSQPGENRFGVEPRTVTV